jgi:type I restriction enzyme, S subunit
MTEEIKSRIEQIKAGQVPEGYKQVHSGTIPVDWNEATISNIADEITDTAGEGEYETLSISAGIGFVNQAQKFGREKSGAQYAKYTVLHRGDFSYNKGNSNLYPQGCIYRLNDRKEAAVPNVFESFRFTAQDGDYYEQLFVNGFLNKQLYSKINHGVRDDGLLNLTGSDFYSCCLPVPPLPEQKKIAEILMQCDKVIELKQSKIEELQELKKACLNKMFPKGGHNVPELRFPGFTGVWEQCKLGEYVQITSGEAPSRFRSGNCLYVKVDDLNYTHKIVIHTQNTVSPNKSVCKIKKGSIIFPKRGGAILTNKVRILGVDSYMDTNMMALTSSKMNTEFLYILISKEGLYKIADTSTIPQINNKHIEPYNIQIPKPAEQTAIGDFFSGLDNLITLHQRELEETQKYKKALMQLLLMGIVRVK